VVQPVVSALELAVPLARREAESAEEAWHRGRLFLAHDQRAAGGGAEDDDGLAERARALDTSLCRLFDAACRAGKQLRALDLVMRMRSRQALEVAHRLAAGSRLSGLAERVDRLRQIRAAEEEEAAAGGAGAGDESEEELPPPRPAARAPAARPRPAAREEEEEEEEEAPAKRARVQFQEGGGEGEETDDDGGDGGGAENIGTPPAPPRRESGQTAPLFRKAQVMIIYIYIYSICNSEPGQTGPCSGRPRRQQTRACMLARARAGVCLFG